MISITPLAVRRIIGISKSLFLKNAAVEQIMFKPRLYQQEAKKAIFDYFYSGKHGNPLVEAPTGSGKSVIIADFCNDVITRWPTQKILILSHTKEILIQNAAKIQAFCDTEIGLWSAGLKSKTLGRITVAGIQSIYQHPEICSKFDLIIVDECHLISREDDSMYRSLLDKINKPVIGFTATPFRLGTGFLHLGENALFDEIVYSIPIKDLIAAGYLCPVAAKGSEIKLDPDGIKKSGGDYIVKDLALAFDRKELTRRVVDQLLAYKKSRKKWLLFAIDIAHAEHIAEELVKQNIFALAVHSKTPDRENRIDGFKNGFIQALVSVAVLTTGFDAPDIDLIGLLRPTASPVLHVQTIGRGLRPSPNKEDCLVLDFAGNLLRNGPIDNPIIKVKGNGTGEPVLKECPECFEIVHAALKLCPVCEHEFLFRVGLKDKAGDAPVLSQQAWHKVTDIKYSSHESAAGNTTLMVTYQCGLRVFKEWIAVELMGYARYKAEHWWAIRNTGSGVLPVYVLEALQLAHMLKVPTEIFVDESGKYPAINDFKMEGE